MPKQRRSKASSKPKAFVSKKRIASDDDSEHDADSSAKRLKTDYVRPKGMQKDDEGSPYWEVWNTGTYSLVQNIRWFRLTR